MPVSHLALVVSNLAAATAFYQKALRPLGYSYCGRQGDSVGFGIDDAEFFLCEPRDGQKIIPTHIAFAAESRLVVRECYTAALNAGGRPSGSPQYRNNDCSCFNAAVEDHDGNTIEFIYREPCPVKSHHADRTPSEYRSGCNSRRRESRRASRDYEDTVASYTNKAHSTAQKALDLASSASQTFAKACHPTPGITRSSTEPIMSTNYAGGKAMVGTLLGAAAGAAVVVAMASSERANAADEARFAASARSRSNRTIDTESRSSTLRSMRQRSPVQVSRAPRPQIEAPFYSRERYSSIMRPPPPGRSRIYNASEYQPRSSSVEQKQRSTIRRASTMPTELEQHGDRDQKPSRYSSRRGSLDDGRSSRQDSAVSMRSHRSHRSSFSKTSTVKPSKHGIQYGHAAGVPLSSSRATSYHTIRESTPAAFKSRSYTAAAPVSLPRSRATSYLPGASVPILRFEYYDDHPDYPQEWDGINDSESVVPDDSISCVDFSGSRKRSDGRNSKYDSGSKSSRHGSQWPPANTDRTIRPTKGSDSRYSIRTLPIRPKDDRESKNGRKSTAAYA